MNADERRYKHEQTTREIIGVFFDVYNELGYGFLESVYREAMSIALQYQGLQVEREFPLTVRFRVGLLLNFGPKPQVRRLAFSNSRKTPRSVRRCDPTG
jgi:hypothetical protein